MKTTLSMSAPKLIAELEAGNSGALIAPSYDGRSVKKVYQPIEFNGTKWLFVLEMSVDELTAEITEFYLITALITLVVVVIATLLGYLVARALTKPMVALNGAMDQLSQGHMDVDVPGVERRDELGAMAGAVQVFKEGMIENQRMQEEIEQTRLREEKEREEREQMERERMEEDARRDREESERRAAADRIVAEQQERVVSAVGKALNALVQGNLQYRITETLPAESAALKDDFNATSARLAEIVAEIKAGANELANTAGELSTGSLDLSRRTEQQAANLEEVAASIEELASTVKSNASSAQEATSLTSDAQGRAENGGEIATRAISAMSEIETSSQKISDIIGIIDEIAFQTNLLALNAAVEAARAGDAGKGFAVVASEVRTLAQRTTEAARDIKSLISASNAQVGDGVRLVNETGEALKQIMESVEQASALVGEIASASSEQATGISEISSAVSQMDEMTQQNSAMVEENTAAVKSVEDQASAMDKRMQFFTLDDSLAPRKIVSPVAAPALKAPAERSQPVAAPTSISAPMADSSDDWEEF